MCNIPFYAEVERHNTVDNCWHSFVNLIKKKKFGNNVQRFNKDINELLAQFLPISFFTFYFATIYAKRLQFSTVNQVK